jgi:shikimate kinase / 3-dehydroquinate synthase
LVSPLDKHVALIGFMGAGKSTIGEEVAERIGRAFVDVDRRIEANAGDTIAEIFRSWGEAGFREVEEEMAAEALGACEPRVISFGGGALQSEATRRLLHKRATTVLVEIDVDSAWERSRSSDRPLAQDEEAFRRLYEERQPAYAEAADAVAHDADDAVLAAGGVRVQVGALELLGELLPGDGPAALVADAHVAGMYGADAQLALGARLASTHTVPRGEEAKSVEVCERLWQELRLERGGTVVALGGGCTSDVTGFVAAAYLRGVAWAAVPTTLVAQVDAAIGGKTAIDLPQGKNLVGAFHWPARTVIDPALLETLPDSERRAGLAEVVKTGLLAGERVWELPDAELVRRCAVFKTAVCLRDPEDRGERAVLNLGHTFAHALEAAGYKEITHGEAVALGLRAALRLSVEHLGLDPAVAEDADRVLAPKPAHADIERAWAALGRDKKAERGRVKLVLLEAPGKPVHGVELPEEDVRRALESLVAG